MAIARPAQPPPRASRCRSNNSWPAWRWLLPGELRCSPTKFAGWNDCPNSGNTRGPSADTRFVLFAGKGGVGKTTLSCVTAVRLAHHFPGKRVLLFSTDPAHSLSACLQAEIGPRPVELFPGLTAVEIDAHAEFAKLKARYAEDLERFLKSVSQAFDLTFDRVVLEKMLDTAPPGLDEIMALTRIMEFLSFNSYDLFVLDCAPTGHLIRLLELPEIINQWLKAFFSLFLKYERILRLHGFADELVGISRNLKKLRELLRNPAASALYAVSIPTGMALEETRDLVDAMPVGMLTAY